MNLLYCKRKLRSVVLFALLPAISFAQLPTGFNDQLFSGGWNQVVGFTFDANGKMYVYEKAGKVWIVENGVKRSTPLIDISEEVGDWRDFGFLGFALDPNFVSNGHIYMMYVVDRHHLLKFGTTQYSSTTNEYYNATIGRITRYTATAASNFTQVDYSSRRVLVGETKSTGIPILHESHGTGQLAFGTDGTLLASIGDGASYSSADQGSASETYFQQGINDGIIRTDENVGAYRSQMLNSYNGKILRIDPATGDGLPSNPFWNATSPRSAQSRVWARGLRNPYRMSLRFGTGSPDRNDGNPGVFFIGDVGWGAKEELDVMTTKGQNFGWPKFEGIDNQPGYNNTTYNPASHDRPKLDWRTNSTARGVINGTVYNVGSTQLAGTSFGGNASTGGFWYTGTSFPTEYQNTYFHADYGGGWIRNISFDANYNPTRVRNFVPDGSGAIVFLAQHPFQDGLLYVKYPSEIRRISYSSSGNKLPIAIASADKNFGNNPLAIQFTGDQSYDPENGNLTYLWEFGDGSTSNLANPTKTYSNTGILSYNVKLTITDNAGGTNTTNLLVSINNTPPTINSTTLDQINTFQVSGKTFLTLDCSASDAQTASDQLGYSWQVALFHNEHNHPEPVINLKSTSTTISPVGCDGATYWYRITLTVTDPQGLSTTRIKDIFPNCGATQQTITFNSITEKLNTAAPFTVSASSTSNLPISYFVVSGPATILGNTVTLTGVPGLVTLVATQHGNTSFAPARPVFQTFMVKKVTVTPPPNGTGNGLRGTYFDNMDLTNQKIQRIDPTINFDWGTGTPDASIGVDTYSIRWEGEIQARYSENYTMSITADDGVRVWVNNQLLVDKWIDQSATTYNFNVNLTAGQKTPIKIEFYENGGYASAKLEWASASQARQIVPQSQLYATPISAPVGTGLSATYFDNRDLTNLKVSRIDPTINFNWGTGSPSSIIAVDTYSARWEGFLLPRHTQTYNIIMTGDDGIRVWVNNVLVIDKWIDQPPTTHSGTIALTAGVRVPIKIEYYENGGGAVAKLEWSGLNQAREVIPQSQLFPKTTTTAIANLENLPLSEIGKMYSVIDSEDKKISIYPNPVDEEITIQLHHLANRSVELRMVNAIGKVVRVESFSGKTEHSFSTKEYTDGMYQLLLQDKENPENFAVKKIVISHY